MAYYTGTAIDHADLFLKLRGHATTNGWTCSLDTGYNIFEKENLKISLQENTASTGYIRTACKFETLGTLLTGSIDPTASVNVVGSGTLFLSEVTVGDFIFVSGESRKVDTITDNTHLTVEVAFTDVANDVAPKNHGIHNLGILAETSSVNLYLRYDDPILQYHAFINLDAEVPCIHCAFEILPSIWRHISFGVMEKIGETVGGAFLFGEYVYNMADWDSTNTGGIGFGVFSAAQSDEDGVFTWTDADGDLVRATFQHENSIGTLYLAAPRTTRPATTTGYALTKQQDGNNSYIMMNNQPNQSTGETVLVPVQCHGCAPSERWTGLGLLSRVALVSMKGIAPALTVTIGGDDWMLFPKRAKGKIIDTGLTEESNLFGYAYKK